MIKAKYVCKKPSKRIKHASLKKRMEKALKPKMRGYSSLEYIGTGAYKLKDGKVLVIDYDEMVESPREWSNLGTFITWDRRYNSPDNNPYSSPEDFFEEWNDKNAIIYFVTKYEHSSIIYSIHKKPTKTDRFDSAVVGIIFVPFSKVRKEFNCKNITDSIRQKVEKILKAEVELYNKYANGESYAFTLYDKNGEIEEAVGGFYEVPTIFEELGYSANDILGEAKKTTKVSYY